MNGFTALAPIVLSELYPDMRGIDRFKRNSDGIFVYKIMAFRLYFVAYNNFFSECT
jgi:hypothetical protein